MGINFVQNENTNCYRIQTLSPPFEVTLSWIQLVYSKINKWKKSIYKVKSNAVSWWFRREWLTIIVITLYIESCYVDDMKLLFEWQNNQNQYDVLYATQYVTHHTKTQSGAEECNFFHLRIRLIITSIKSCLREPIHWMK